MRKILITILIMIPFFCYTQENDFAPIGAKWYYSYIKNPFINIDWQGVYILESARDTVVSGKNCRILTKTINEPYGTIRDMGIEIIYSDSSKVYHLFNNDFYVLYNFGADVNDSWIIRSAYYEESIINVDSVGSIIVNDDTLKTFYTSASTDLQFGNPIIEKIGDIEYYLFPGDLLDDDNIIWGLRCYEDNHLGYYNLGLFQDCEEIITANSDVIINKKIRLLKNVVNDGVILNSNELTYPIKYYITNITGIRLKEGLLTNNNEKILIDLDQGVYLIDVYDFQCNRYSEIFIKSY